MLRRLVLQEHLHPPHLLYPWLLPVLAGWLWLHRCYLAYATSHMGIRREVPHLGVTWLLGGLVALWLAWSLLVQLRRIDPHDGTGFLLSGFGVWAVVAVDTLALVFVELPPHYFSAAQFGQREATLCLGAGYVAYAVGVGLVVGGAVASWRRTGA